jgi:hypothetical protein
MPASLNDLQDDVHFQSGGTLGDDSVYVERAADRELPNALIHGEPCYVLGPRQMGKSSLRARTERRLRDRGVRCVTVDLCGIGTHTANEEIWYCDLVEQLARPLDLHTPVQAFWEQRSGLPPPARFTAMLREVVLPRVGVPVVIFIDEIDAVLGLPAWRGNFFGALSAIHRGRDAFPAFGRLTFCLLGVAAPRSLVAGAARAELALGRAIRLEDFTRGEAHALLPALGGPAQAPLLDAVLDWTDGHPYMTQRVCEEVAARHIPVRRVPVLVRELFLRRGRVEDPNLSYAERQFSRRLAPVQVGAMLALYKRLVGGERLPVDDADEVAMALRLAGMAAPRHDGHGVRLCVRNRIFAAVFDRAWVREKERELKEVLRPRR